MWTKEERESSSGNQIWGVLGFCRLWPEALSQGEAILRQRSDSNNGVPRLHGLLKEALGRGEVLPPLLKPVHLSSHLLCSYVRPSPGHYFSRKNKNGLILSPHTKMDRLRKIQHYIFLFIKEFFYKLKVF